ncbi:hypothetical protein [Olsenella sp. Marseille-P4559]|uniref:hypothetical protein n=1 Tax=Olsenella sp. Marseille-P4559 TaxID=2364795 RepID=UPI0010317F03|nr:hypothetical protein [Olsenella sp. Marseille-P4559]
MDCFKGCSPERRATLISEARAQTDAIQRLEVWARADYGLLALGVILGLWRFTYSGPAWAGGVGIALAVAAGALAAVFYVGIRNAKRNVEHILCAAGIDLKTGRPIDEATGKPVAATTDTGEGAGGASTLKGHSTKGHAPSMADLAQAKEIFKILYGRKRQ